jgi:hypothetical protein
VVPTVLSSYLATRPVSPSFYTARRSPRQPPTSSTLPQEYVLSPELTARELLWQARGCLAHVHILTLLVQHAAEQLGPAAALPDGTAIAAAATAANAAAADAAAAGLVAAAQPPPPAAGGQLPAAEGRLAPAAQQQLRQDAPVAAAAPPRPRTPPRKDEAALVRQQSQRQAQKQGGAAGTEEKRGDAGPESSETTTSAAAMPASQDPQLPPDLAALGMPNAGDGAVGVHAVPPTCRGTLADEYGILWRARTADLQQAASIALVRDAEANAAAAAEAAEAARRGSPPRRGKGDSSPKRMDTMTMGLTAAAPPTPPYAPERAARLQLLIDVLAAAQEPLEWSQLARIVITAEPPAGLTPTSTPTAASTPGGTQSRNARSQLPENSAGDVAVTPGSPVQGSGGGANDGAGGRAASVYGGGRAAHPRKDREGAVVAAAALRDLDWALQVRRGWECVTDVGGGGPGLLGWPRGMEEGRERMRVRWWCDLHPRGPYGCHASRESRPSFRTLRAGRLGCRQLSHIGRLPTSWHPVIIQSMCRH